MTIMIVVFIFFILITLIRAYFLISTNSTKSRGNHKSPKYAYEIFSDNDKFYSGTNKKLAEEKKQIEVERKQKEDFYKDAAFTNKN